MYRILLLRTQMIIIYSSNFYNDYGDETNAYIVIYQQSKILFLRTSLFIINKNNFEEKKGILFVCHQVQIGKEFFIRLITRGNK
jgi:hypothetical protein